MILYNLGLNYGFIFIDYTQKSFLQSANLNQLVQSKRLDSKWALITVCNKNCGPTNAWVTVCVQLNSLTTRCWDTQAQSFTLFATRQPYMGAADEARSTEKSLGQMLNTSIRVWSSFCCMLAPSSLVRVILSVNYSNACVKNQMQTFQRWKQQRKGLDIVGMVTDPTRVTKVTQWCNTAEISIRQVHIRCNTAGR